MNYRVLAVLLTAVLIIAFSACGAGGGYEAAHQPEQSTSSHSVDNQTHPKDQKKTMACYSDGKSSDARGGGIILFLLVLVIVFLFRSC